MILLWATAITSDLPMTQTQGTLAAAFIVIFYIALNVYSRHIYMGELDKTQKANASLGEKQKKLEEEMVKLSKTVLEQANYIVPKEKKSPRETETTIEL